MTTLLTVLVLAIFVAILFVFYRLQQKHIKFSTRVFAALFVGIVFGGTLQLIFGNDHAVVLQSLDWIKVVGNGYVSLLQMLIMPLVFVSIVSAFTRMKESGKIGKNQFYRNSHVISNYCDFCFSWNWHGYAL